MKEQAAHGSRSILGAPALGAQRLELPCAAGDLGSGPGMESELFHWRDPAFSCFETWASECWSHALLGGAAVPSPSSQAAKVRFEVLPAHGLPPAKAISL